MIKTISILMSLIILNVISQDYHDNNLTLVANDAQDATSITCYCTSDENCDHGTAVCHVVDADHTCYERWSKTIDNDIIVTAGCIYDVFFFKEIFCNTNKSDSLIICCRDRNLCNDRNSTAHDVYKKFGKTLEPQSKLKRRSNQFIIGASLFLFIIVFCSLILLLALFYIKRRTRNSSSRNGNGEVNQNSGLFKSFSCRSTSSQSIAQSDHVSETLCKDPDESKTRLLTPITFSKQVTLEKRIGVGGYGSVYRGIWYQDIIAVKIFLSNEEPSWSREVHIYEEFGLNHENILRFIAADNIDHNNRIELWLGTEYHENGSVYDYLSAHTITISIMLKMLFSIANGLFFLHLAIEATNGKPALAHRDLKTKNILVKKDLSCCIADLGLAVREVRQRRTDSSNNNQENIVIDICPNHRAGTIRYMAPEILDKSFNDKNFESYKATDLYALGLVFWEILRRCQTSNEENDADPYEVPYQNATTNNPNYEQMREVICDRKIRPPISSRWENHPILRSILGLCQELWTENPACRPNSYVVKEKIRTHQNQ